VNREESQFAHGWNAITPAMLRKSARKRGLALRSRNSPPTGHVHQPTPRESGAAGE
jgi:hypothetical protein